MLIRIVHEPTREEFFFRFQSRKQAANALAVLEEYGVPMFLERYGRGRTRVRVQDRPQC
jgi:hypothetical protein